MLELAQLIGSIGAFIAAIAAFIVALRMDKKNANRDAKIQEIYVNTNGRLDHLTDLVASAFEKGEQSERDRARDGGE